MMQNMNFEALGTKWIILIDSKLNKDTEIEIKKICIDFENNYSRFKPTSLISKYNIDKNIKQTKEFSDLLKFGKELEKVSGGFFNPQIGKQLSKLGYGNRKQGLDFGGYGKGWLINKIAEYLKNNKYECFLINAGGDIFATQKSNSEPWNVALEHPTNKELLIGTIKIKNQSLCGSSPFKRSWKEHNHLLNGKTGVSINKNRSVFTLAKNAKIADGLATTLNVVPKNKIQEIANIFSTEYLIIEDNNLEKSKNFDCIIFD